MMSRKAKKQTNTYFCRTLFVNFRKKKLIYVFGPYCQAKTNINKINNVSLSRDSHQVHLV